MRRELKKMSDEEILKWLEENPFIDSVEPGSYIDKIINPTDSPQEVLDDFLKMMKEYGDTITIDGLAKLHDCIDGNDAIPEKEWESYLTKRDKEFVEYYNNLKA